MDLLDIASIFLKGRHKTYSFSEITGVISHPSLGVYTLTGRGTGSISIAMTGEKTTHEIASDGTTLVMQVPGSNGTIALSVQQTSDLHNWLLKWYNYLTMNGTERSEWARATVFIRSISDDKTYQARGVSPQNIPTIEYGKEGKQLTWTLMVGDLTMN